MKEKFKKVKINPALSAGIMFTICGFVQRGIQLLTIPIYTRLMSTTEYGEYSVFLSWYDILLIIVTLRIGYESFNVGYSKFETDRKRYMSSLLGLNITMVLFWMTIFSLFKQNWLALFQMSEFSVFLIFLNLMVIPAFDFYSVERRFKYEFKNVIILTLTMAVTIPGLSICLMQFLDDKGKIAVYCKLCVQIAIAIPIVIYIIRYGKTLFVKKYWLYALKLNIPLVPYYLSLTLLNQSDRLMINNMCGKSQAGIFGLANSGAMVLTLLLTTMNQSFVPWLFGNLKKGACENISKVVNAILAFFAVFNLLLVAVTPEAVKILAPKEYTDAIWIIPILTISCLLKAYYSMFTNIIMFFEKTYIIAIGSVMSAIVNIILNYIFIPIYGYFAAAYTSAFSYALFAVINYFVARTILRKKEITEKLFDTPFLVVVFAIFIVAAAILMALYQYLWIRCIVIVMIFIALIIKRDIILKNLSLIRKK